MTAENRRRNALAELQRATDALREAEVLGDRGLRDGATSRAYYAAFHAARALLVLDGQQPRSHRGVHALLERNWVANGKLDAALLVRFARLQERRSMADYAVERPATAVVLEDVLDDARAFVAAATERVHAPCA